MIGSFIVGLIVMVGLAYLLFTAIVGMFAPNGKISESGDMICPNCGTRGTPKSITRGSFGIELLLWLCFLIPGLIYSLWRMSSTQPSCPSCGHIGMIPVNSPNGLLLVKKLQGIQRDPHERSFAGDGADML